MVGWVSVGIEAQAYITDEGERQLGPRSKERRETHLAVDQSDTSLE